MNDLTTIKDEIENDYKFYCKNISKYGHPMSLESIYWIIDFLNKNKFNKIADFGSGFSSYIIRKFCDCEIYSYDTDGQWLKKTVDYLNIKNLSTDNMILYEIGKVEKDFDFIIWDLGNKNFRRSEFLKNIENFENTICLIDDCHDNRYITMCRNLRDKKGYQLEEIKEVKDEFGRYVSIVAKSGLEYIL